MFNTGLAGAVALAPFFGGLVVLLVVAIAALLLSKRIRLLLAKGAKARYSRISNDQTRRLILKLYQRGAELLARKKYRRRERWETVTEYARNLDHLPSFTQLTLAAEIAAYRLETPDEATATKAKDAFDALKLAINNE